MWKEIKGYEGLYEVSTNGMVRRIARVVSRKRYGNFFLKEKELALDTNKYGYMQVPLTKNGKRQQKLVHRLVLSTFFPINNEEEMQVNHIDGNKRNNNLSNLEWNTLQENITHSIKIGHRKKPAAVGLFLAGVEVKSFSSLKEAAKQCNMCYYYLRRVVSKGKSTKIGTFKYINSNTNS